MSVSKFYVILTTVKADYYIASVAAILFSVVSAYYYLRIVKIMYFDKPNQEQAKFYKRISSKSLVVFVAILNLLFIFYLKNFLSFISGILGF